MMPLRVRRRTGPPRLRAVVAELRGLNRGAGPIRVTINPKGLVCASQWCTGRHFGAEQLPGEGQAFDAVAVAGRLLAALQAGTT